ncbi:MAG: ATPase [Spirochaeta sp. LUC14_002_19_P3]|nr:MAG: ATPase [Spirochaeta sp. LUC14_002_19_P3]
MEDIKTFIESGRAFLGIELGSTRVKAVLIGEDFSPLASGSHGWENSYTDGIWTYSLEEVWEAVASAYSDLAAQVHDRYSAKMTSLRAAGCSGMMHGYLVFNSRDELLVPFRTWRNNISAEASAELTRLLNYPIPQRWSIAHLQQAIINGESHVKDIAYITTLAAYVHWKLCGKKTIGIGEASGMFPISISAQDFDEKRMALFDTHNAKSGILPPLRSILPQIVPVGEVAGTLSEEGAKLLDRSGRLKPGIPLCPPESDGATGMTATNSVREKTGNVSAGTSVFVMLVLDREPSAVHEEIDLVTTPDGKLVGMVHSNNCTSDYDAWIELFGQAAQALGAKFSKGELYDTLLTKALEGDADCGGLLSYGYVSGEHITGFSEGRPLVLRMPESNFTLANLIRSHLFTSLCALRKGMNVLTVEENMRFDEIRGHGGFFKTAGVGQRIMAAATNTPISLLATAGEGGAWGMALLAAYAARSDRSILLPDFLDAIMENSIGEPFKPLPEDVEGFNTFFRRYLAGLPIERAAVECLGKE